MHAGVLFAVYFIRSPPLEIMSLRLRFYSFIVAVLSMLPYTTGNMFLSPTYETQVFGWTYLSVTVLNGKDFNYRS